MSEEERQRVIRLKLARMQSLTGPAIPTGFGALDEAMGVAGLPRGRIVELFGPSSAGKTTLALQILAHTQQNGFAGAWIDADHSFDAAYATRLSVNLEALPVAQPESAEEALEVARQLAVSGAVDLLVVDSAAALVPRMELETGLGESSPGMQSRVLASGLRKLSATLARTGVAILFLNQTRGGAGDGEVSAGGPGLKLYAAVRIFLEPAGRGGVRFRTVKNKVAAPFAEGILDWDNTVGFAKRA
jgi:recombination protein RecA